MEQFPHLKLIQKIEGKPRFHGGGESPQTELNKANRAGHSSSLQKCIDKTKDEWDLSFDQRDDLELATLDKDIKPIFLQVNPNIINTEFDLESFEIEIISEEEDGLIIGASLDNFRTLEDKVTGFINSQYGTAKVADFWKIFDGNREDWKPKHILSEELYSKWDRIQDDRIYELEVSIAFNKPLRKRPNPNTKGGNRRLEKYNKESEERDDLLRERESHFEDFINHYGQITSSIVHLDDCFGCEVSITGKGLKDLAVNYQFVFEIVEIENISGVIGGDDSLPDVEIELITPDENAVEIGVIDSGIMEGNKYLSPAIKPRCSRSYIAGDDSTADHVSRGGHGTKVAGAILYPNGISVITTPYKLPFFVRNLRVLDANNQLPNRFPAELMQQVVGENEDCKIFNLSIGSNNPHRKRHMSNWAAVIDKLIYEKDVLFVIAAGNIPFNMIGSYLRSGKFYPTYLTEPYCQIANPAHSSFGITVGSINHCYFDDGDWRLLGEVNEISGYSRIGTGIWGHIKPDVVEYGGGVVFSDDGIVKEHAETATELVRSTLHGGNAFGKDSVGTSFSAPKVAHIAAKLKHLYPDEGANLIRAFIVQGARLPGNYFYTPTLPSIRHFGYGLPSLDRVTRNTEHRITFYSTGNIKSEEGHLYSLSIPNELRGQGDEYDILIEVSLAYTGRVRRTRQKTNSYLSTWLDWSTSKIGESFEDFKKYALSEIEQQVMNYDKEARDLLRNFDWKIKNRNDWGINGINRNNSTLQKDWTIIKSFELPEEICFAVRGHKGWDKNKTPIPYAFTVSIEILGADIPIYELIRIENEAEIPIEI